jgi:hypothetical protein
MLTNYGLTADEAAMKSIELTQRAADMASVFNVDVRQALEAIQAALRGEADPIEKFGVSLAAAAVEAEVLELGLAETKAEIDATDKATARLSLIMEQTDKVAGDFVNTSDSLANQQRILAAELENAKAELGERLIPAFKAGVETAGDFIVGIQVLVDWIEELPGPLKAAVTSVIALTVAVKAFSAHPMVAALTIMVGLIADAGRQAKEEAEAVNELRMSIEELGGEAEDTNTALLQMAATAGIIKWAKDNDKSISLVLAAVKGVDGAYEELFDTIGDADAADDLVVGTIDPEANKRARELLASFDFLVAAYRGLIAEDEAAAEAALALAEAQRELELDRLRQEAIEADGATSELATSLFEVGGRLYDAGAAARNAESELDELNTTTYNLYGNTEQLIGATDRLLRKYKALSDPVFGAIDAMQNYEDTLATALEDGVVSGEEATDVALAWRDAELAMAELGGGDVEAGFNELARLIAEGAQLPLAEADQLARDFLESLGLLTAGEWAINFTTNRFGDDPNLTPGEFGNPNNPFSRPPTLPTVDRLPEGARAMGGPVSRGRSYLVGERGPETFVPSSSGTIVPNGQTGMSVTINATIQESQLSDPSAARKFVEYVSDEIDRYRREN